MVIIIHVDQDAKILTDAWHNNPLSALPCGSNSPNDNATYSWALIISSSITIVKKLHPGFPLDNNENPWYSSLHKLIDLSIKDLRKTLKLAYRKPSRLDGG